MYNDGEIKKNKMFESIKKVFSKKKREELEKKIKGVPVSIEDMLIPKRFRGIFGFEEAFEKEKESILILVEKENQIPKEAKASEEKGERIVKNGYFNTVEVLAGNKFFSPLYIKFKRRRWKNQITGEEYGNQYDFHPPGMKVLHEFAEHLKKISRRKFIKLFRDWNSVRDIIWQ